MLCFLLVVARMVSHQDITFFIFNVEHLTKQINLFFFQINLDIICLGLFYNKLKCYSNIGGYDNHSSDSKCCHMCGLYSVQMQTESQLLFSTQIQHYCLLTHQQQISSLKLTRKDNAPFISKRLSCSIKKIIGSTSPFVVHTLSLCARESPCK